MTKQHIWVRAFLGAVIAVSSITLSGQAPTVAVFEGARLIVGDGSAPIDNASFVVEGARITQVGRSGQLKPPAGATRINLAGKTVMPGIIDTHTHLADTREGMLDQLQRKAFYGASVVMSLGTDAGDLAFKVREERIPGAARLLTAGRGITMPEPGRTDVPYWVTTDAEARKAVTELAAQKVDFVKIWVDDRNGKYKKLTPELYGAVIDEAHKRGNRVTVHVYYLEDAKGLLKAGVDAFAHGVRDKDIDDELMALVKQRPNFFLVPNLPDRGVATDMSWLSDSVPADELKKLQAAATDRPNAQQAFAIQARNLAKLNAAGVKIALGTDGNIAWSPHVEMEDMVAAGMTPHQVIVAATRNAAELLALKDHGTIAAGKSADFIVLDANPLDDIKNTRRISDVYIRGTRIDRDALRAKWRGSAQGVAAAGAAADDKGLLGAYRWRSIGPNRGGRSITVAGVKGRPLEAYFGATGGGLWKTMDGGNNWSPVTDGQITSSSVGAVAVSESNPDVVYIGMGESCIRGNIMPGDGVYKSTDAGKTWNHIGFRNVDAISKIRVHPSNPDIAYVAAFGQYYGPSEERGVFKTTDGGKTWRRTLFRDPRTGAVDLALDRNNPNVIYAALWEAYRVEYQMSSGGPGSGLYKSTDAGETWSEITRNPGMPTGVVGRIGVAVTAADSNRVYALVENAAGGLFVSDDAGATWKMMNDSRTVRQRAFYYTHVHADQKNKDIVYLLNTAAFRSTDAGKTLVNVGQGTHGDFHDLWTDPDNSDHLVVANDGGGAISFNIASPQRTWSDQDFPTAQWYHVVTTAHYPFHVCGSQQDNSTMCVPSNTNAGGGGFGGVPPLPSYQVGGGEPGYIAPDRTNPDLFFAGSNNGTFLTRYNHRTGALKEVGAYPRFFSGEPAKDVKERWQWTYPIIFSYVDPNVLYASSQRVWRTTNGGDTWEAISGDLTRHDPKTMEESGGPITHDMNSPEIYGTVFSLAPGKKNINVLWAGSDDGVINVTRDHGKTWVNITPREMPEFGRVSQIDGSSFDDGTAYVAVKKMLLGDRSPYIFRTRDFGQTWARIVNGIAANDYVHVVREDPTRRGLLYAGTQHGAYISFNDGDTWLPFANGLPDVPVTDLVVEKNAIAIGTHGRSFYVMDDIAALRQSSVTSAADVQLFKPADVVRGLERAGITYQLKAQPKSLTLEFLDAKGQVMRRVEGRPPQPAGQAAAGGGAGGGGGQGPPTAPMAAGVNRFSWDLNSTPVVSFPGMILWGATQNGPMVLPGTYSVRLTADGVTATQAFSVVPHPLRPVSMADLQYQWDLASRIRDKVNEANLSVIKIRRIKDNITTRIKDAPKEVQDAGAKLTQSLAAVEEEIYQVRNQSGQDPLNFPIKTNNRLASLLRVAVSGEGRPTGSVEPIFNDLAQELKGHTDRLDKTLTSDLAAFNRMLTRIKREPISDKP